MHKVAWQQPLSARHLTGFLELHGDPRAVLSALAPICLLVGTSPRAWCGVVLLPGLEQRWRDTSTFPYCFCLHFLIAREELCSLFPERSPPPLPRPPPPCSLSSWSSSPSQACNVVACHRGHQLDSQGIALSPGTVRQLVPQPQNEARARNCQSSGSSKCQNAPGGLSRLLSRNRKHRENIRVWGLWLMPAMLSTNPGVRMGSKSTFTPTCCVTSGK